MKIELDTRTISKQEIKSLIQMLNTLLNEPSYNQVQPMAVQSSNYGLTTDTPVQQTSQHVDPSPSMFGMFDTPSTTSSAVNSEASQSASDEPNIFSLFADDNSISTNPEITPSTQIEQLNPSETQPFNAKSVTQILEDAQNGSILNNSENLKTESVSKTADLVSKIFRQDYEKKEPKIITY